MRPVVRQLSASLGQQVGRSSFMALDIIVSHKRNGVGNARKKNYLLYRGCGKRRLSFLTRQRVRYVSRLIRLTRNRFYIYKKAQVENVAPQKLRRP